MSFSNDVKNELLPLLPKARHCMIAELAAFCLLLGRCEKCGENRVFRLDTENAEIKRKYFTLLNKTISISGNDSALTREETEELFKVLKIREDLDHVDGILLQQTCCKKAFIRGAYLATGSLSNPATGYHFEIVLKQADLAKQIRDIIISFGIEAKIVPRKNCYVVYVKESECIEDLLAIMGANVAYLKFENIRIEKEMRNSINRKVNCETANITKTVSAAVRQMEDIRLIDETRGLKSLPANLREIAEVRLEHPDVALKDLGNLLDPPVGKSGVNHRLRRIGEIANTIRISNK